MFEKRNFFTDKCDEAKFDEMCRELDYDYINGILNEGVAEVKFVKKDGTNRIMLCTTNSTLIPERAFKSEEDSKEVKPKNPDVAVIWDLQKDAWRSFRYDSVTSAMSHPAAERY